jgi:hypothetical protein
MELISYWAPARGWSLGLGATVNDRVDLDVRYATLINPEIDGELRYGSLVEEFEGEQPMSWIRLAVGVRLR